MFKEGSSRQGWAIVGGLSLVFALVLAVKARVDALRWDALSRRATSLLAERQTFEGHLKEAAASLAEEKALRDAAAKELALEQAKNRTLSDENEALLKEKDALEARLKGVEHAPAQKEASHQASKGL